MCPVIRYCVTLVYKIDRIQEYMHIVLEYGKQGRVVVVVVVRVTK